MDEIEYDPFGQPSEPTDPSMIVLGEPRTIHSIWDLPIARWAWSEDAADLER